MHSHLKKITHIEKEIELALNNNNFVELDNLSRKFAKMVRELVEEKTSETNSKPIEIGDLSKLIDKIQEYQVLTEQKFRKYTEGVARSRKMHEAYK